VPATPDKKGCKDHVDGQGKLLEFIKMSPIIFCDYKVRSGKLRICTVLAKKYSETGVLICIDL